MEEDVLMYPLFGRKTKDLNLHQTIQQTSEVDNGKEKGKYGFAQMLMVEMEQKEREKKIER